MEAKPTQPIPGKPPAPMEELPPEDRPDGNVAWIGGYWSYDEDRKDFLWVSGCWRVKPEHREWVPGYWREVGDQWQWVAGFWGNAAPAQAAPAGGNVAQAAAHAPDVTYYPTPPAPPHVAPPGDPPGAEMFYVPGYWQWTGTHYVWRAGYWQRVRPSYIYIAGHYCWTPTGYVFIPGYWDYTVARRGVIYAPVFVNPAVVPATYVYSPAYAVSDVLVLDAMFVYPGYGHYYFGDYYGPVYANRGYVTTVVYSRSYYEPIVVYQRWEYRDNPRWFDLQINIAFDRNAGRSPLPPRTLIEQQRIIVNNTTNNYFTTVINNRGGPPLLAPARTLMAARNIPMTRMDAAARMQVRETARAVQVAAATERKRTELAPIAPGSQGKPITRSLAVPTTPVAPKAGSTSTVAHPTTTPAPTLGGTKTTSGAAGTAGTASHPGAVSGPTVNPAQSLQPLKKFDEKKKAEEKKKDKQ